MADLTIHDVPDATLRALRRQAHEAGQSLNDYLVACLTAIALQSSVGTPARLESSGETMAPNRATLPDEDVLGDIAEGDAAYARGDVVRGAEAIRALRPQDRS